MAGKFSKIRFGAGLAVTDEGAGVITVSGAGGGGAPTGPAGGVLAGSYPNPTFAADMATQTELDTGLGNKVDRDAVEAATARLVQVKLAAADTQPAFKITGDGKQQWGQGGTATLDTDLFRLSAGLLKTTGGLVAAGNFVARQAAASQIYLGDLGDARPSIAFGSSSNPSLRATSSDDLGFFGTNLYIGAALDTALFRAAAAILACNGAVTAKQLAARVGADLAATSGAITVTNGIHRVTSVPGSSISTINGGYDGAIVTLINRTGAILNLATGGNIQMATNPTLLAVNAARMLVFNALEPAWQVTGG